MRTITIEIGSTASIELSRPNITSFCVEHNYFSYISQARVENGALLFTPDVPGDYTLRIALSCRIALLMMLPE